MTLLRHVRDWLYSRHRRITAAYNERTRRRDTNFGAGAVTTVTEHPNREMWRRYADHKRRNLEHRKQMGGAQ